MAFNTSSNKRVFYATQGVAIGDMGATGVKNAWGTSNAGIDFNGSGNMIIMHGLQSIGVNTNFSLEAVQELGQLSIYENVEEVPDIEATFERLLDGYTMAYHAATITATDPTLSGRANARADLRMVIGLDTDAAVSSGHNLAAELYCSGMYWSSCGISLPTDGNFTESLTLVGNNKKWLTASGVGVLLGAGVGSTVSTVFNFGSDSPNSPDSGVLRRNNFLTGITPVNRGGSTFITVLPSFITGVGNSGTTYSQTSASSYKNCGAINTNDVHVQSISFSVDAGREAINVNLEGVQAALNIQQERVNRAEEARRNPAASGRSSTLEESLLGPFMNIQRVLGRLNNPATRDDPAVQARNVASLERVTAETVERGFGRSLHPFTVQQDQRTARMVGQLTGDMEGKILELIETTLGARVRRIEDNEKLSARANTEKKDQLQTLLTYPPEPGASPDTYRKALAQSNHSIRVIEKSYTFTADPFNYVMMICRESNKLAADFLLDQSL
jgi:hypothetical protein